jgi:hypothetical protein
MKPIVIDVNCMTFQGMKDAIDEAYEEGYKDGHDDGYKEGQRSMQLTWHYDPVPTYTTTPNWWYNNKHEVTCSESNENKINS